jgi:periplasmic protein CpxP/Spy
MISRIVQPSSTNRLTLAFALETFLPANVSTHATAKNHQGHKGERQMNATKATIILGALLSASIVFAQAPDSSQAPAANSAQAAPSQPGNQHRNFSPQQFAAHLGKRLGLSGDQVAQITPILMTRQQQMQTLRADTSLSVQDRHTKAHAIMQDTNSKIEAVLTDPQKQQFEQMLAQRRARHNRQPQSSQPQA